MDEESGESIEERVSGKSWSESEVETDMRLLERNWNLILGQGEEAYEKLLTM